MKYNKLKRYFLTLMVFSMLTSCFCFKAAAAEIDIYETESNNTTATADVTEDLADNLGRISSASDVDYYKITFDRGGITNFWLGNIPSGCDYQMQIFKGTTLEKTINNNSTGTSEFAQYNTLADTVYYIKISSNSGYNASSYYLFSMRRNNLGETRFFTYEYIRNNLFFSTRDGATKSMPYIWKTGYSGQEYLNNKVAPVYNSLTQCDVMVIDTHGNKGFVTCNTATEETYISANYYITSSSTADLEDFDSGELSNLRLLVFCSCYSGCTDTSVKNYGNLVDMARQKGAQYVLGWTTEISTLDSDRWLEKFFEYCKNGYTIERARTETNEWMNTQTRYKGDTILQQYKKSANNNLTIN